MVEVLFVCWFVCVLVCWVGGVGGFRRHFTNFANGVYPPFPPDGGGPC